MNCFTCTVGGHDGRQWIFSTANEVFLLYNLILFVFSKKESIPKELLDAFANMDTQKKGYIFLNLIFCTYLHFRFFIEFL